uniref:Putative secreted protein n=1 Tax=Ixodes ricinus TaxID=34613 RepID=A0A0K8RH17_IXORI
MRVIFVALLSASFILCRSTQAKTHKKKTSDAPVVTIGYMLYEPNQTNVTWESKFNTSVDNIHKNASWWLKNQTFYGIKLQTESIMQVGHDISSKLDALVKKRKDVNPFTALNYVEKKAKEIKNRLDILCLVTQTPLTIYKGGFGSYHPLCEVVVPLLLTFNSTNVPATGENLGFLIRDTLNITNLLTWYRMKPEEKKRRFKDCRYQREFKHQN